MFLAVSMKCSDYDVFDFAKDFVDTAVSAGKFIAEQKIEFYRGMFKQMKEVKGKLADFIDDRNVILPKHYPKIAPIHKIFV